jgi:hypothetical protein
MSVSINQMIRAMHKARHEIEINQIGGLSAELTGILDRAERKLYRERDRFFKGLSTDSKGHIIGSVKNINEARMRIGYVKEKVEELVKKPGMVWGDKMVSAMGNAGRELARVNLTTDFIPQAKIDAVFKHVSSSERAILKVGRYDAYSIMGTVGDDINEFFRREMLDSVAEGIPIQGPGDTLSNRLFASGRLKAIPIQAKNGRTIMRSAKARADAIARIESAKILNATHQDVTKQALGDEAVYRNSNPQDSRTTDICKFAAREKPMTLAEWSRSRFGRPPRLSPFHLCRSVLIGGMEEWFEDDGNPDPVQDATPPPQPDNPKIKGPQDFDGIEDRLKYYAEGDNIIRDVVSEAARKKRKWRKLNKEHAKKTREMDDIFEEREAAKTPPKSYTDEIDALERERVKLWGNEVIQRKDADKPRLREINEQKRELARNEIARVKKVTAGFDEKFEKLHDEKGAIFKRMTELDDSMKDYAAKLIGNADQILVDGLPIQYKTRPEWKNVGTPESRKSLNNLLGKQNKKWIFVKEKLQVGRDFVNRVVHRGDSDLPKGTVTNREPSLEYDRAEKVLKKNLDDGHISQEKYDAELRAIAAVRAEFNKWKKSDSFYQPSFEQDRILRDLFKKAGWSEDTGWSEVEIKKYAPFKGLDYDMAVSDRSHLKKGNYARAFARRYITPIKDKKGLILVDKGDGIDTVVHELGHLIESNVSGVHEAAMKFLRYRTRGEAPSQLKKLFPNYAYDDWETGKKDKFENIFKDYYRRVFLGGKPDRDLTTEQLQKMKTYSLSKGFYTGKEYSHPSSEVISMGVEFLYLDPVTFARADPEYFKFIVGILRGDLRYY